MPYNIHPLKPEDQARAYALVRLMKPALDLDHWQTFLESALEPGASRRPQGVIVAAVGEDTLVGLYTWEVQPNLDHGHVLSVDNLIATGPLNPEPLLKDMLGFIEAQATEHVCDAIQIILPNLDDKPSTELVNQPVVAGFLNHGFSVIDQKLCKQSEFSSY